MNATFLDQALETALTDKDFGSVRTNLREQGYALAQDESEPDVVKALQLSRSEDDDEGTFLIILEKEIRSRQAQTLRHILFMTGHKIARPDLNKLSAEEEVRRAAGFPVYVPQNSLEL
jgi:hypothetical protein